MQETNENMKKISLLLMGVITAFCLVGWVGFTLAVLNGCSSKAEPDSSMTVDDANGLVVLCTHYLNSDHSTSIKFVHDTCTDNIYLKSLDLRGESMLPYYNAEGKIMKYDEFMQVHKH